MLSREKVEAVLRSKGIDLQKLERAVGIAYKSIPIPSARRRRPRQQDGALTPVQLGLEPPLAGPFRLGQGLVQRPQRLRHRPLRFGQQRDEIRRPLRPRLIDMLHNISLMQCVG